MSNDFLSRWSRRKLQAETVCSEGQATEAPAPQVQGPDAADEPPLAQAGSQTGDITPEELAALPAVDDLTAGSDMTAFLRRGVPQALRNDALRRMWTLDPAIRDYVGDARDYAWDWNTPGGVPVSGPIPSTMDVAKMVRGIFGHEPEAPGDEPEPAAGREEMTEAPAEVAQREVPAPDPVRTAERAAGAVLPQEEKAPDPPAPLRPRGHGGALPS